MPRSDVCERADGRRRCFDRVSTNCIAAPRPESDTISSVYSGPSFRSIRPAIRVGCPPLARRRAMTRDRSEIRPVLKTLVVFGTRPEAIKLAPVVAELRARAGTQVIVCVTGQHREMLDQVLGLFGVVPDHDLDVMRADQRPEHVSAEILRATGDLARSVRPDVVLVQGDTTTAMAGSLGAFFARVPVGHVEAGLRTGIRTSPFPEEMMRRIVSEIAYFH